MLGYTERTPDDDCYHHVFTFYLTATSSPYPLGGVSGNHEGTPFRNGYPTTGSRSSIATASWIIFVPIILWEQHISMSSSKNDHLLFVRVSDLVGA